MKKGVKERGGVGGEGKDRVGRELQGWGGGGREGGGGGDEE
jgi:hypothetical protein